MKEILTKKVAPDFGCKSDKKFKILGNIDLPISHYFVGQNNVYSNSKELINYYKNENVLYSICPPDPTADNASEIVVEQIIAHIQK